MYNVVKSVIESKAYDLADIIRKIEYMWVKGKLTEKQKEDLQSMARISANAGNSVDMMQKLEEFDKRITALEKAFANSEPKEEETTVPGYEQGKWYYAGDKVTFDGKTYECIAPDGVVCVWNPNDYPVYWKEV